MFVCRPVVSVYFITVCTCLCVYVRVCMCAHMSVTVTRTLADVDRDGQLRAEEFILAMHLVDMAKTGHPLPLSLPADLVPPSFR